MTTENAELADLKSEMCRIENLNQRFEILFSAIGAVSRMLITRPGSLESTFEIIVDQGRHAVGANYAALGIGKDPDKVFSPWVFSGMNSETEHLIGRHPRPVGVLGLVAKEAVSVRIDDLSSHPRHIMLPEHHPQIIRFLGVPIWDQVESIGNLYFGRDGHGEPFSQEDQHIAELFAVSAGVAIEAAKLHNQANRALLAREEMVAIVSHDLRNPLHNINLYVHLLLAQLPTDQANIQLRKSAEGIRYCADQMAKLIQDLFDVAQIESGKFSCVRRLCATAEIVSEAVASMRPMALAKGIQIQEACQTNSLIPCDRQRIIQVFGNLIGNAIKFSPPNSIICINAKPDTDQILFSITDQGPGIKPEDQSHIFDRYWQGKQTRQSGLGLGLAIAKGIVDCHGGKIWVETAPGAGSTFYIALPIRD